MPILTFVFQGWPESAALIFTAFAIVGYRPSLRQTGCYSLLLVTIIYLIRMLSQPFGLHTLVGLMLIVVIINRVTRVSLGTSFFAAFLTMLMLAFLESGFQLLIINLIGNLSKDQGFFWIMVGWPQTVCLVWAAIIIGRNRPFFIKKHRWLNEQ